VLPIPRKRFGAVSSGLGAKRAAALAFAIFGWDVSTERKRRMPIGWRCEAADGPAQGEGDGARGEDLEAGGADQDWSMSLPAFSRGQSRVASGAEAHCWWLRLCRS
jgi:hypothetical protein